MLNTSQDEEDEIKYKISDVVKVLSHENMLSQKDEKVRILVAFCLVNIFRIYAPESPLPLESEKKVWLKKLDFASNKILDERCVCIILFRIKYTAKKYFFRYGILHHVNFGHIFFNKIGSLVS